MPLSLAFHPGAIKQLEKIEPEKVRSQIKRQIDDLKRNPKPRGATKLAGPSDSFRLRQGEHRVVYALRESEIIILKIGHGREVYRS